MARTTILQVTDTHGAATAGRLALDTYVDGGYDMLVITGDVVASGFDDPYTLTSADEGYPLCLGNHDVTRGLDWGHEASRDELVAKYHLDAASNPCGISRDGWAWWHRDVNDVTVLGFDCCMASGYDEQTGWLRSQLQRCIDGGRWAVLCSHIFDSSQERRQVACSFTNPIYQLDRQFLPIYPPIKAYSAILDEYVGKGLKVAFACYGHDHSDELEVTSGGRVKNFVLGSTVVDVYNDLIRTGDTSATSCVVMNLYVIDTDAGTLDVVRIGARNAASGRERRRMRLSLDGSDVLAEW